MRSNAQAISGQQQTTTRAPSYIDFATYALVAAAAETKRTHPEVRPSFAVTVQTVSNAELVPAADVHQRGNAVLLVSALREASATAVRSADDARTAVYTVQLKRLGRWWGLQAGWVERASVLRKAGLDCL